MRAAYLHRLSIVATLFTFGVAHAANTISTRSPFMPTVATPEAAPEQQGPTNIEWCGIMEMNGERYFGLTETEKSRSAWLRLNEEGRGFSVKNFTEVGPTLTVTFNSQTHTLRMKEAKVGVLPPGSFPATPVAVNRPGAAGGPGAPAVSADADQQRRLEAVAAEVRRRREMRAAAASGQLNPSPQGENGQR
jgi:hypothetical protein